MSDAYNLLIERIKSINTLSSIAFLLDWDQEVLMPEKGVFARTQQMSLIAGLSHKRLISDETQSLLENAEDAQLNELQQANVREIRRIFDRQARIPTKLVRELAETSTNAKGIWAKARERVNFEEFSPALTKMIELKRRVADCVGYADEPYDALLDEYEPYAKTKDIETLFADLGSKTAALLRTIEQATDKPDASILNRHYPQQRQETLCRQLLEVLNFDFSSGRVDTSVHPFCTTIGGPGDVRITTRYLENFIPSSLFGTMHECGHALYEQGLPIEHLYTPLGEFASLGLHESQSRFWENCIGRSLSFWKAHYNKVKTAFPNVLSDASVEQWYGAINHVTPSFIRVEADELTYNLHIVLRFELERAMIRGDLDAKSVPAAWNEKFEKLLGIVPPNDREGCLQDIHWSMGLIGYFPTYTLGNLYAAQLLEKMKVDMPDFDELVTRSELKPILNWLRENIHRQGRRYRASTLIQNITGKPVSIEPFMNYVTAKISTVYGL